MGFNIGDRVRIKERKELEELVDSDTFTFNENFIEDNAGKEGKVIDTTNSDLERILKVKFDTPLLSPFSRRKVSDSVYIREIACKKVNFMPPESLFEI